MRVALISFARQGSTRLPEKNTKLLNGKPLIQYTLECMKYVQKEMSGFLRIGCYVLTDYEECKQIAENHKVKVIMRPKYTKEWDDLRLNVWADSVINADAYVLLQPTNPFRNFNKICDWIHICYLSEIESAFSVYRKDRKNYEMNGSFFYYTKSSLIDNMFKKDLLSDDNVIFIDDNDIDIDTEDDFKKAVEYANRHAYQSNS